MIIVKGQEMEPRSSSFQSRGYRSEDPVLHSSFVLVRIPWKLFIFTQKNHIISVMKIRRIHVALDHQTKNEKFTKISCSQVRHSKIFFGAFATTSFPFSLCWTKSMPFFNVKISQRTNFSLLHSPQCYSKSEMLPSYYLNPLNEAQSKMAGLIYSS